MTEVTMQTVGATARLKRITLAMQHFVAMFGATVLVPILTGFNPSVAIFCGQTWHVVVSLVYRGEGTCFFRLIFRIYSGDYQGSGNHGKFTIRSRRRFGSWFNLYIDIFPYSFGWC